MAARNRKTYTEAERLEVTQAIQAHNMGGRPEIARDLQLALDGELEILPQELSQDAVVPEIPVADYADLVPPPRSGVGSTEEAWRTFANNVTAIEPDVIAAINSRDNIIQLLEDRGIIPQEGFDPADEVLDPGGVPDLDTPVTETVDGDDANNVGAVDNGESEGE